jgi:hypothetical protein
MDWFGRVWRRRAALAPSLCATCRLRAVERGWQTAWVYPSGHILGNGQLPTLDEWPAPPPGLTTLCGREVTKGEASSLYRLTRSEP